MRLLLQLSVKIQSKRPEVIDLVFFSFDLAFICSCGSGRGFNSQRTHILIKIIIMYSLNAL